MHDNKQKQKPFRKMTPPTESRHEVFGQMTNIKSFLSPKRTPKLSQKKHIVKQPYQLSKKVAVNNKNYLFNKTTAGTPFQKSVMLSYISTPNEKSFNLQKQKMLKADSSMCLLKNKEQYHSTQDQNYSEEVVKVTFSLANKKLFSKNYPNFVKMKSMTEQFITDFKEYNQKSKVSYYGFIGFEAMPFNHALSQIINEGEVTFQWILNQGINELTLVPCMLKKPLNYDNLDFGDFDIIKFLGSGGFSQVYLARCKLDHQYCALKFIRKDSITSAKKVKMLQNQKNILFSIKNEHLIDLLYAFQTKNFIVFGLEYCPNGNLYSYLQKMKSLKQQEAKCIFAQILKGLEYLHNNNIIFRDIKLENILFDSKGRIKITDFGLSKPQIDENEITYSYCGSPQYMAPQMLTKSGHSFHVDYYALGILLYELLFGKSPFYAPKKEDIFMAILNSQPKFPKSNNVSKEVKSLIRGLLAKNPNHRIGSLKGVKQILSHPWFRNVEEKKQIDTSYSDVKPVTNKEANSIKDLFHSEQSGKLFERCFFSQYFVNRGFYERNLDKIVKIKKDKQVKSKNNFFKRSNSKNR